MRQVHAKCALDGGRFTVVRGYEFVVDGLPLVVHRTTPETARNFEGWSVTEPITGRGFSESRADTRRESCERAEALVRKVGVPKILRAVRKIRWEAA